MKRTSGYSKYFFVEALIPNLFLSGHFEDNTGSDKATECFQKCQGTTHIVRSNPDCFAYNFSTFTCVRTEAMWGSPVKYPYNYIK